MTTCGDQGHPPQPIATGAGAIGLITPPGRTGDHHRNRRLPREGCGSSGFRSDRVTGPLAEGFSGTTGQARRPRGSPGATAPGIVGR